MCWLCESLSGRVPVCFAVAELVCDDSGDFVVVYDLDSVQEGLFAEGYLADLSSSDVSSDEESDELPEGVTRESVIRQDRVNSTIKPGL